MLCLVELAELKYFWKWIFAIVFPVKGVEKETEDMHESSMNYVQKARV